MAYGFDCATKLNSSSAAALRAAGFDYVARYLGNNWKTFDAAEAKAIQNAGLKLISIFEKNSTKASYFSKAQGIYDAQDAFKYAKSVGQPAGTAIYFTVDYDAQTADMARICDYLDGVRQTLVDYKIGLYGSYDVMMAVKGKIDFYWQTYAWSHGKVADFIHMRQYQNGVMVSGIQLDRDEIKQTPGAWNESQPAQQPTQNDTASLSPQFCTKQTILQTLRCDGPTDIRVAPNHAAAYVRDTVKGEVFHVFDKVIDAQGHCWNNLGGANWTDEASGVFYWLDNPALQQQAPQPTYYVIQSGDALSKIAKINGTSVSQLQSWNGIKNPNVIRAGHKIRVK